MFIPTTTVTLEAPVAATDVYGFPDPAGSWTTRAAGVAAHLADRDGTVDTPTLEPPIGDRTTRAMRALFPRGTTVAKGDRVTTAAGTVYLVDRVWRDHDAFGISPVRADLVGGGS